VSGGCIGTHIGFCFLSETSKISIQGLFLDEVDVHGLPGSVDKELDSTRRGQVVKVMGVLDFGELHLAEFNPEIRHCWRGQPVRICNTWVW
jgi:hypothetical protein